jgi:predicted DNA-binding antitoxin AbrB/MazE fold protein
MQAIRAVYDGVGFRPKQPIPVQEKYEVVITFLEPVEKDRITESEQKNIFDLAGLNLLADDYDYKKMREARSFGLD